MKINKINIYFYLLHPFLWMWLLSLVCSTEYRITPTVCYCHWWIYIYSGRERKMTENFYFKEDQLHRMLCMHTPVPSLEPPLSSRFYWNTLLSSRYTMGSSPPATKCRFLKKALFLYYCLVNNTRHRGTWRINDWNILMFTKHIYSMNLCFCYIFLIFIWTIKISIF